MRIKYEVPVATNEQLITEMMVPTLEPTSFILSMSYCRGVIGMNDLSRETVMTLLPKMGLLPTLDDQDDDVVHVLCPITRRDILHPCDIVEDVAIAFGYNK